jgi:hypothetical protein
MTNDELDDLPLADEAKLEASSKVVRRGIAALRGTRRSNYLRRAVLKVLAMSREEREAFDAPNGFFEMAKLLVEAPSKGRDGAVIVQVWKEIKETLGERIGSNWKETQESKEEKPAIINDLPSPESKFAN